MSNMSLRLPKSLHAQAKKLAKEEDVSINQLVATALAEKMSALMTGEYLQQRGAVGDRKKFMAVMRKVRMQDRKPVAGDDL